MMVTSFGGPEVLALVDTPVPGPGPGEVLVEVVASTVNPIDLSTRSGRLVDAGLLSASQEVVGVGWDVAGYVRQVGPEVRRIAVGDPVVGLRDRLGAPGAHAEYVLLDEGAVAPAPRSVTMAEAATLPLNGLTADGCLTATGVGRGATVLVTGAGGGVGGFVLELAAIRGIHTIGLGRRRHAESMLAKGASHVVHAGDVAAQVREACPGGVDAVIDAANLGIDVHGALRSGGTFVTLVRPFAPPPIRGTRVVVHEVWADGARLTELSALVDAGHLTLQVAKELPLREAATAHALVEGGGLDGRVVLTM